MSEEERRLIRWRDGAEQPYGPPPGAQPAPASAASLGAGDPGGAAPGATAPTDRGTFATWGAGAALLGFAGALIGGLFLGIPVLLIDQPATGEDLSTGAQIAAQVATVIGFFGGALLVSWHGDGTLAGRAKSIRDVLTRLGVRRFKLSAFGWMALSIVAYLVFAGLYSTLITTPEQDDIADSFGPVWVQVILIVALAASSEELCFRGMLFGGFNKKMPLWLAVVLSGLIFGGLHALTGITAVPPLMVFGMILALLYDRTGSILPGMILHALNNTFALLGQ